MQTLKFAVFISTIFLLTNCTGKDEIEPPKNSIDNWEITGHSGFFYQHLLRLSFQDASGNDLVKGIGYDSEYDLENQRPGEIGIGEFGVPGKIVTYDAGETVLWKYGTYEYIIVKLEDLGGIVKPDLYTLEYIFPDGIPNPWKPPLGSTMFGYTAVLYDVRVPQLNLHTGVSLFPTATPAVNMDFDYLCFSAESYREDGLVGGCDFAEKITFRLTCPYLFGDNAAHDIITWWEKPAIGTIAKCYHITFEGREFTEIVHTPYHQISVITVDR